MSDTKKRIAEIRERLEKATPGPWTAEAPKPRIPLDGESIWANGMMVGSVCGLAGFDYANAELIAHAPSDITFLLEQVEKSSGWVENPNEQTWWWHWNEDADSAPHIYYIMVSKSGKSDRYFVQFPDSRWCDEIGGKWLKVIPPPLPVPPHRDHLE